MQDKANDLAVESLNTKKTKEMRINSVKAHTGIPILRYYNSIHLN